MTFEEGFKEIRKILKESGVKETILKINVDGEIVEVALIFEPKREDSVEGFKELIKGEPALVSLCYGEEGVQNAE